MRELTVQELDCVAGGWCDPNEEFCWGYDLDSFWISAGDGSSFNFVLDTPYTLQSTTTTLDIYGSGWSLSGSLEIPSGNVSGTYTVDFGGGATGSVNVQSGSGGTSVVTSVSVTF